MYRCKICSRLYDNYVKYCDCGGSDFEKIVPEPEKTDFADSAKKLVSWIIFILCILGAVVVWFI